MHHKKNDSPEEGKRTTESIHSSHNAMELQELNAELIRVNNRLKEAEAMKTNFISNVMNELVNPFASIVGLAQSIMTLREDGLERARSFAKLIYGEAFHLDFQLKNIFMAAKLEAGIAVQEAGRVDVATIVQTCITNFGMELEKKGLLVTGIAPDGNSTMEPVWFNTDAEKLTIIIANLLSNAIKFSDPGQPIDFSVSKTNNYMTISIIDHGKGIEKGKIQEIFDRFRQLDSTIHTLNSGYGLGLSVTGALVDILGGEIRVKSTPGEGSEFVVTIPASSGTESDIAPDVNEFFFSDEVF